MKDYHLYHGTSLEALNAIIQTGMMHTAAYLRDRDQLVWGELKGNLNSEDDKERNGPKYMHPSIMGELGIELSPEDEKIFGHAFAIFFANHPQRCFGYTPKDNDQQAIIVLNKNAMENRGHIFTDCREEGIKCESSISLDFGLAAILVPDEKVDQYKAKVQAANLFTQVYKLGDVRTK